MLSGFSLWSTPVLCVTITKIALSLLRYGAFWKTLLIRLAVKQYQTGPQATERRTNAIWQILPNRKLPLADRMLSFQPLVSRGFDGNGWLLSRSGNQRVGRSPALWSLDEKFSQEMFSVGAKAIQSPHLLPKDPTEHTHTRRSIFWLEMLVCVFNHLRYAEPIGPKQNGSARLLGPS